ncbi:hypothetical protein NIBR502772_08145 [Pseudarthrobacter sp. NIBRBAC000502772]|uniref:hypothetical protein n=1 Tax=Pseudarthrobacter sp. NIBRBAC000502772 TaxID=2590775 RepID=UPI001130DF43|nr:hypothetical protein [Pseudarthrobacter sp. NIBRBAC000502772]QDG66185.1 hypothetical protein NIBR502772_08145 [Pseudarthrobacter sp. NIBRBAC000502772]
MSPAPKHRGRSATAKCLTAAAAFLLAGSLAACGPAEAGLQRDAARQLQARVLGVTQASATNDPAGGLAALDSLEADLASAARTGQVSEERRRSITTAATAVRADLTAAKALADAAAAKVAEDAAAAQRQADADAAQKGATAPVAPAPSDDKGNRGKGKDGD